MRIARDALVPAAMPALAGAVALWLGWPAAGVALLLAAALVGWFFRDPERSVPAGADLVVSPADGRVTDIVRDAGRDGDGGVRLSIFLSLFDVHVNRSPLAASVEAVEYRPGSFLPAFARGASARNEQNRIRLSDGRHRYDVVQIAGILARRIVCRAAPGDRLERGQRIGLIKFGSRVDLVLPEAVELQVRVGDRVRGASSVIGRVTEPRHGAAG
jgi:phosphatidylserine decarboxylase